MSNATTLQTNNNKLSANNTDLATILNTINNLPEAGSGGSDTTTDNVQLTWSMSDELCELYPYVIYSFYDSNCYGSNVEEIGPNFTSKTIDVLKGSFVYVVAPYASDTAIVETFSTGGVEDVLSIGLVLSARVTETGTLGLDIVIDDGGLGGW